MAMGYGVCFVVGCDYLRESWVQSHGTTDLNATGQEREKREVKPVRCRLPGWYGRKSFPGVFLLSQPSSRNSIAIAIAALLQFAVPVSVPDV